MTVTAGHEIVERVARAICAKTDIAMAGVDEVNLDDPDFIIPAHKRFDKIEMPRWKLYVDQARAAIAVCREEFAKIAESVKVPPKGHPQIDAPEPGDLRRVIVAAITEIDDGKSKISV